MFDLNNKERIMELIDDKPVTNVIEPLYIRNGNQLYGFDEIDTIDDFNPSMFKVGFGTSIGLFVKSPIPKNRLQELDIVNSFKQYKEDIQCERLYYVFEHSIMIGNDPAYDMDKDFYGVLYHYIDQVYGYLHDHTMEIRKQRIASLLNNDDE